MADFDVVTAGEAMLAMVPADRARLLDASAFAGHTAGAESNLAIHLARLGFRSAWIGRLGADPIGDQVALTLRAAGVDIQYVTREPRHPTGVFFKDFDGTSTHVYYYRRSSAGSRLYAGDVLPAIGRARVVHLTGITPALSDRCLDAVEQVLRRAPELGVTTSFDVNFRPSLWRRGRAAEALLRLARLADIVLAGSDEVAALWQARSLDDLRQLLPDAPRLVLKDAAVGATSSVSGETTFARALAVPIVEPVGAGDGFAAGYLAGVLRNMDEMSTLRMGHLVASFPLRALSDHTELPPWETLEAIARLSEDEWNRLEFARPSSGAVLDLPQLS